MKPAGSARHFLLAFVLALVGYAVCYQVIEQRRTRRGPWQVSFTTRNGDLPTLVINHPKLGVTNVQIVFPAAPRPATNGSTALTFREPRPVPYEVPFGQCVFMDTTFLPGTLVFKLFGHEIELLPRVLIIDRQEHPWRSDAVVRLDMVGR